MSWCSSLQGVYAEWVGAQAKLALFSLEAHAQCRAFAAGLPDLETNTPVTAYSINSICPGALPCRGYMRSGLALRRSWHYWKHMLSAEPLQQGCQIRRQRHWSQRRRLHMKGKPVSSTSNSAFFQDSEHKSLWEFPMSLCLPQTIVLPFRI